MPDPVRRAERTPPAAGADRWAAPDPADWRPPAGSDRAITSPTGGRAAADEPTPDWTPPSWDEVVRDHSARVYRLAYRLTGNPHDAEDLTQDVFVRVFRSLHTFRPGTFEGWLHRITTNLFLDSARRRQKIRFDGLADGSEERLPSNAPTPGDQLADADLDHDVAAALAALAPEFRAAVVLCDIEGLAYEDIAAALGVKIGTVRSRIHRGRAQLRAALAHRNPSAEHPRYFGVDAEPGASAVAGGSRPVDHRVAPAAPISTAPISTAPISTGVLGTA